MATTRQKSSRPSPKSRRSSRSSRKSYVRLRTLLDALELGAVRFYLEGESVADRNRRAKEIERQIRPMLELFNQGFGTGCPPGLFNCGGCCLPYPCPREL